MKKLVLVMIAGLVSMSAQAKVKDNVEAMNGMKEVFHDGRYQGVDDTQNKCSVDLNWSSDSKGHPVMNLKLKTKDKENGHVYTKELKMFVSRNRSENIEFESSSEDEGILFRLNKSQVIYRDASLDYTRSLFERVEFQPWGDDEKAYVHVHTGIYDNENDPSEDIFFNCEISLK